MYCAGVLSIASFQPQAFPPAYSLSKSPKSVTSLLLLWLLKEKLPAQLLSIAAVSWRWGMQERAHTNSSLSRNRVIRSCNLMLSSATSLPSSASLSSSARRLFPHAWNVPFMLAPTSCNPGSSLTNAMTSGATTNSINPSCMLQRATVFLSHMGDTSYPSSVSRSPCAQNSSVTLSAHLKDNCAGRKGLETSAQCSTSSIINVLFLSSAMQRIVGTSPVLNAIESSPLTSRNSWVRLI
mmetsp:Transcript_20802/g.46325  ORF Transcript_20802/g.46325 Transcript_20802/m.46325 type:complete len:238 (+) Transcript_20802:84-797(+)